MIGCFLHFDQGSQSSKSRWSRCCIVGNWTCFSFFLRGSVLTHSLRTRVSCGGQATVTRMCQSVCRAIVIKLLFLWRVRTSWPWEKEHSRWADARHRAGWQVLCRAESCVCVCVCVCCWRDGNHEPQHPRFECICVPHFLPSLHSCCPVNT